MTAQEIVAVPSRNISLTDHFDGFVERSIRAGRFANASEVVRAGLHLLERREQEQEERRAALKAAAAEGFGALDRNDAVLLDGEQSLRQRLREIGRAARAGMTNPAG
jgi:antitoxin ParD1/3/4